MVNDAGGVEVSAPRYGPAVLRALGRVQVTRARIRREQFGVAFSEAWVAHDDALKALWLALDEDRAAAVPALPDEGERDASPHRFAHPHGGPL